MQFKLNLSDKQLFDLKIPTILYKNYIEISRIIIFTYNQFTKNSVIILVCPRYLQVMAIQCNKKPHIIISNIVLIKNELNPLKRTVIYKTYHLAALHIDINQSNSLLFQTNDCFCTSFAIKGIISWQKMGEN